MLTLYKMLKDQKLTFDDCWAELLTQFPDAVGSKIGYEQAWDELLLTAPNRPPIDKHALPADVEILIENIDLGGETIVGITGWCPGEKERYALEYTPWEIWLSMPINEVCLYTFSPVNIAAHCLWEMTFCGFTNKAVKDSAKEMADTLEGLLDSAKNNIDGGKSNDVTFEELRKKLEELNDPDYKEDSEDEL